MSNLWDEELHLAIKFSTEWLSKPKYQVISCSNVTLMGSHSIKIMSHDVIWHIFRGKKFRFFIKNGERKDEEKKLTRNFLFRIFLSKLHHVPGRMFFFRLAKAINGKLFAWRMVEDCTKTEWKNFALNISHWLTLNVGSFILVSWLSSGAYAKFRLLFANSLHYFF